MGNGVSHDPMFSVMFSSKTSAIACSVPIERQVLEMSLYCTGGNIDAATQF